MESGAFGGGEVDIQIVKQTHKYSYLKVNGINGQVTAIHVFVATNLYYYKLIKFIISERNVIIMSIHNRSLQPQYRLISP